MAEISPLLYQAERWVAASSGAHVAHAMPYNYERRLDDAKQEHQRTLSINPNNARAGRVPFGGVTGFSEAAREARADIAV